MGEYNTRKNTKFVSSSWLEFRPLGLVRGTKFICSVFQFYITFLRHWLILLHSHVIHFSKRNFLLCGHLYIISFLLFNIRIPFIFPFIISSFSVKHTSHFLSPLEYFRHFLTISHSIVAFTPFPFNSLCYFIDFYIALA